MSFLHTPFVVGDPARYDLVGAQQAIWKENSKDARTASMLLCVAGAGTGIGVGSAVVVIVIWSGVSLGAGNLEVATFLSAAFFAQ